MREVVILAKFVTGASATDAEVAEAAARQAFWLEMERIGISEDHSGRHGLFRAEILAVESEDLRSKA